MVGGCWRGHGSGVGVLALFGCSGLCVCVCAWCGVVGKGYLVAKWKVAFGGGRQKKGGVFVRGSIGGSAMKKNRVGENLDLQRLWLPDEFAALAGSRLFYL